MQYADQTASGSADVWSTYVEAVIGASATRLQTKPTGQARRISWRRIIGSRGCLRSFVVVIHVNRVAPRTKSIGCSSSSKHQYSFAVRLSPTLSHSFSLAPTFIFHLHLRQLAALVADPRRFGMTRYGLTVNDRIAKEHGKTLDDNRAPENDAVNRTRIHLLGTNAGGIRYSFFAGALAEPFPSV